MAWRKRLRSFGAGLVVDLHGDLRSGITGLLAGAPVRLGYASHQQKEGNFLFTTHRIPAGERRRSRIERNLDLVRALGLPDAPLPDGGLAIPETAVTAARAIAAPSVGEPPGAYAVIAPGVSRRQAYKKPPAGLLAAAARTLSRRNVPAWIVFGPGEEQDAERVAEASGGAARLAPPTDLPVLAALLRGARLFVGGDTGPLHLACAVGCPVLGLYGPTDPCINAPWGVPHLALYPPRNAYAGVKKRDRLLGFDGLDASTVEDAVATLLDRP